MRDAYAVIKGIHVSLVVLSGALFAVRGLLALLRQNWAQARWLRTLSQVIDTGLLVAAISLLLILQTNPFTIPWLLSKLSLLVVYILLGHQALNRPHTRFQRVGFYLAALLCFLAMVSIAQHHHPLGALRMFV